jgi:hypothetical protein
MNYKDKWLDEIPNIKSMGLSGMTLKEIGKKYNVTGAYIYKLNKLYKIFNKNDIWGSSAKAKVKSELKIKQLFLRYGKNDGSNLYKAKRAKFIIKQSNMKRAGIEFNLNFGEIDFPEYCPILGIKLDYFAKGKPQNNSPSFDRIDSTKGYVTGNVLIISNKANRIKSDGNIAELQKILEYLEKNLKS